MNSLPQTIILVSIAALATACSDDSGGQVGEETAGCLVVESTSLEVAEESPLGWSAQDFLDAVAPQQTVSMQWADDRTDSLSFTMSYAGSATYHVRQWVDDGSVVEIQYDCDNVLEIEMSFAVATGDGSLDATWTVPLIVDSPTQATLYQELKDDFDHSAFVPVGSWDATQSWLSLSLTDTDISGSIEGQAERTTGSGYDGVAEAHSFAIATIGQPDS